MTRFRRLAFPLPVPDPGMALSELHDYVAGAAWASFEAPRLATGRPQRVRAS